MKELTLLVSILLFIQRLTVTGAEAVGSCPLINGPRGVLLPDDQDCHLFYLCSWGRPQRMTCGSLLFDYKYEVCNYPDVAECYRTSSNGGDGNNNGGDSGESWMEACTFESTQVYYPDPEDCQSFYMCDFGKLRHMSCPNDTLYNAPLLTCDHPENVRCSQRPGIEGPEEIDPEGGGDSGESWILTCNLESTQMYYPNVEDCQGFYMCVYGNLIPMSCPNGTLYNAALLACDHSYNVRCSQKPGVVGPEEIDPDEDGSGESWTNTCSSDTDQLYYPDTKDCQSYYICVLGNLAHMTCPPGTLYNAATLTCDYPENVVCSQEPEDPDPEPVEPEVPGENGNMSCTVEMVDVHYADPEKCREYYICSYGTLTHYVCDPGTLYNSILQQCDKASNVQCSDQS